MGVACKDGDDYTLLTGNEMGVLLLDYICRMRAERGENLADKVAVTTIVSSAMVDALAAEYGFELRRCLTGFKYIGDIITELADAGAADRFMFGFEESYGYLSGDHVRDKDAVNASLLICQMAQAYKLEGKNLAQAMRDMYAKHGWWLNRTVSLAYPGADGARWRRLWRPAPNPRQAGWTQGRGRGGLPAGRERPARGQRGGVRRRRRQQGDCAPQRHRAEDQTVRVREGRQPRSCRRAA